MPMEDSLSLVSKAREGSSKALEDLLQANLPGLRAFIAKRAGDLVIARDSVTDVVQSTCREVLQALPDHDYENEVHFRHWLYQTALRKIVDRSRYWTAQRRDVAREVPIGDAEEVARRMLAGFASDETENGGVERVETLERVEEALRRLSKRHRDVIVMAKFMGVPHADIAEHFQMSEAAARAMLHRAMGALRVALSGDDTAS